MWVTHARFGVRSITGVDISEAAVRLTQRVAERRGIANARFLAGDLARLSSLVAEESFDAAYCLDTLEHAEDFWRILAKVRRALWPGGRFFLLVPMSDGRGRGVRRRIGTSFAAPDSRAPGRGCEAFF